MQRAPRGSEKRKRKEAKRIAERFGECQVTKRRTRDEMEKGEKRDSEPSEAMRRAPSDSEKREMMRGISKKL